MCLCGCVPVSVVVSMNVSLWLCACVCGGVCVCVSVVVYLCLSLWWGMCLCVGEKYLQKLATYPLYPKKILEGGP